MVTGVQHAIVSAELKMDSASGASSASSGSGAYSSSLITVQPALYTYGTPTFYLPEPAGYPRFFVADVTRAIKGINPAERARSPRSAGRRCPSTAKR